MKKILILTSALFAITASSAFAAQPNATTMDMQAADASAMPSQKIMMKHYIPGYDQLTPEKKAIFDKMHSDLMVQMRAKMSMLMAKRNMLDAKLMQPTIDKKEVDGLIKEINDLEAQLLQQRVDSIIKIKDATGITIPLSPKRMFMHRGGMGMGKKMAEPQNNN
jgi:Spy/CpxP family protein refolding chaperone